MTNQKLESICSVNPENLGPATPQDYLFKYIDISSVNKGRIHWNQVNSFKYSDAPSRARRRIRKDDILLCTVRPGLQAHAQITNEESVTFVASTGFAVLRPNNPEDSSFIYHQIFSNSVVAQLRAREVGSNYPAVNESDVRQISVFMPEPSQRRNIGEILDTIDAAITKTDAVIAKLNQVRAGMLHDLLSYGLDENGQLRDPIAHPEHFKGSPLGRIPRAWDVVSLLEIAEILFSNVDKVSKSGEKPIRLCNYIDVYNNDYIEADMDFMHATATLTEIMKYSLKVGDVVITKDSETPNDIGIPSVVITTVNNLLCGYHLALIRPNQKSLNSVFLAKQFESKRVTKYFSQQANGTTRYGLSTNAIANIPITLPEIDEQNLIAKKINESHEQIETLKKELDKLKHLKSGLQDDLLSGRVRVPETIMEGAAVA